MRLSGRPYPIPISRGRSNKKAVKGPMTFDGFVDLFSELPRYGVTQTTKLSAASWYSAVISQQPNVGSSIPVIINCP